MAPYECTCGVCSGTDARLAILPDDGHTASALAYRDDRTRSDELRPQRELEVEQEPHQAMQAEQERRRRSKVRRLHRGTQDEQESHQATPTEHGGERITHETLTSAERKACAKACPAKVGTTT